MYRLVIVYDQLLRLLAEAVSRPGRLVRCPAGQSRNEAWHEFLAAGIESSATIEIGVNAPPLREASPHDAVVARLDLREASGEVVAAGYCLVEGILRPIDEMVVVGRGRQVIPFGPSADDELESNRALRPTDDGPWSRTIGALGVDAWQAIRSTRAVLAGAGRTGGVMATALVRLGVGRVTIIDDDLLEPHNLPESESATHADLGRSKAAALAESLSRQASDGQTVSAIHGSVTQWEAIRAVKSADVVFACVDDDAARLTLAMTSACYLRPMFDIAAGIHFRGDVRDMGADVRFVLPGRCLACFGGLRTTGREPLRAADFRRAKNRSTEWRRQRAGSLRSLNQMAAALGVRMFEDWLGERIDTNRWTRLQFDDAGRLQLSEPDAGNSRRPCEICAFTGAGDEGPTRFFERLRQRA